MPSFDYIVSIDSFPQDNKSFINKASVLFKGAGGFSNANENCEGYNFNRCPNDDAYNQPFVLGDKIYLQYLIDVKKYFYTSVIFINSFTGDEFDGSGALTTQPGLDLLRGNFLNLMIDTAHESFSNIECWYIKIKLYKCSIGDVEFLEEFLACAAANPSEPNPTSFCYNLLCDDFDYITSEPFAIVKCNQNTLLIEGAYDGYDCNGNFYGLFANGDQSIYKAQLRIAGSVESQGFVISKTVNNLKTIKSQQQEKFLLRSSKKIPYYVVQQLSICFNSAQLIIDDVYYTGGNKIDKNFDEGQMWIINETILKECSEINFSCE